MIVWLASYPRSGNTFCRVLLRRLYGLPTYDIHEPYPTPMPQYEHLIGRATLDRPISALQRDARLHVVKTHEIPRDDYPAIYLVRDGRDAAVSYAWYVMPSGGDYLGLLRHIIESPGYYGGWSRNVRAWTSRRAPTALVRFDDLITNPTAELQRAMTAIGLALGEPKATKVPSFSDLHAFGPQHFRKGRTGAWRDDMPDDLHLLFWRRHGATMRALGYTEREPTREELVGKPSGVGEAVSFGTGGEGCFALREGWAEPEEWGTWSIDRRALLQLSVGRDHACPLEIVLTYRSFVEGGRTLEISCYAGGRRLSSWTCGPRNWCGAQCIRIPPDVIGVTGAIDLEFEIDQPRSPAELGLGSDLRELELGIESMQLMLSPRE